MNQIQADISVQVDLTNPGQFFACCGLFELADRLWPGAEGWFEAGCFHLVCDGSIEKLIETVIDAELLQIDPESDTSSPMLLAAPFDLLLDWWHAADSKQLKVWAGSMRSVRIAEAMRAAMASVPELGALFDFAGVVYAPDQPSKKIEPYYFDSRRGQSSQAIDIGFAPDALKMKSAAHPAVEFLCLVGLQRFRPAGTKQRRMFVYYIWHDPLPLIVAASVASGMVRLANIDRFQFENAFRTDQKKHKSFLPAVPLGVSK